MTFVVRDDVLMHAGLDQAFQRQVEQVYQHVALILLSELHAADRAASLDKARRGLRLARDTYHACRALVAELVDESTPR